MHALTLLATAIGLLSAATSSVTAASILSSEHDLPLSARQNPAFPSPYVDPFYKVPANISAYANGQIIRRRSVPTTISNPNLAASYQLLYAFTNTTNQRDATVATVWAPKSPKGVILSYQNYEDSTSFDCSPSWALVKNSGSPAALSTNADQPIFVQYALSQNWHAVIADHEGPKAAFIAGHSAGNAVLDGIRAARASDPTGLPSNAKVVLHGYSGGAHATAWAVNNFAGGYAADLNIVGAAYGGTPIDPRAILNFLNGGLFAGFAIAGVSGMSLGYPSLDKFILANLNAAGQAKIARYRGPGYCVGNVATGDPFTNIYSLIDTPAPLDQEPAFTILKKESLLNRVAPTPRPVAKFPVLEYHGLLDEIVPKAPEDEYVAQQCLRGANIQYQIFPVSEHITTEVLAIPAVLLYLRQAVDGTTPKVICGTALPSFLSILDPSAPAKIGQDIYNQILALNNTQSYLGKTIKF